MQCEQVRDLLIDVTRADVTSTDAAVRDHLRHCAACRDQAQRMAHVWSLLAAMPDAAVDSPAMRDRFMDTLARELVTAGAGQRRKASLMKRGSTPLYQAAAVILVFVVGVLLGRSTPRQTDAVDDLAATRQELRELRGLLTLSLIRQDRASERLQGVSAAALIDAPPPDVLGALVDTLQHDPDVNVRLASIRVLERFGDIAQIQGGAIQALGTEESPLVSIALIEFVERGAGSRAVAALSQLAEDETQDEGVRMAASEAITRMRQGGRI